MERKRGKKKEGRWKIKLFSALLLGPAAMLLPPMLAMMMLGGSMTSASSELVEGYKAAAERIGASWQEMLGFDTVRYDNDLDEADPEGTGLEFLAISYKKYVYLDETGEWVPVGGGFLGTSGEIRATFALGEEGGLSEAFDLMEALSLPTGGVMYSFSHYAKTLEDVMEEHAFTDDQIEWAGMLVLGGVLNEMFGDDLPDFAGGYIAGAPGAPGGYFAWPLPGVPASSATSSYGPRIHPVTGVRSFHYGTDIGCPIGTPVVSIADGTVASAGENGGTAGTFVTITHSVDGHSWTSKYFHLSQIGVGVGDVVSRGSVIAKSGNTGRTTGPHLHIETICDGQYQNPLPLITGG